MTLLPLARTVGGSDEVLVTPCAWLRNRRRTRVWSGLTLAWAIAIVAVMLLPGRIPHDGPRLAVIGVVTFYLVMAAGGVVVARRVARSGVWIGPDAIVVRGPFTTRTVALGAAIAFGPGLQGAGGNGVPCPLLSRVSGRPVGVWALGRRNVWCDYDRRCAEIAPLCDALNATVDRLRGGG